jgi:heat shock transcription factor
MTSGWAREQAEKINQHNRPAMASQGVSRKRPAPGTSPLVHQQMQSMPNFPTPPTQQLSNDQFLQWGQNPPPNANQQYPDLDSYNNAIHGANPASAHPASNQLARRSTNHLVSRMPQYEDSNQVHLPDQSGGSAGDQDGSRLRPSEADLEQKAQIAKKDAQAKRKQIPPFVQKLRRYVIQIGIPMILLLTFPLVSWMNQKIRN